MATGIIKSVV